MTTVRQIERYWTAKAYKKLLVELTAGRAGALFGLDESLCRAAPSAALALIRLEELSQAHSPLCGRLVRTLLATQERDGGWGDAPTTALCVRALTCGRGRGEAIDAGLQYLRNLQKDDGIWPAIPLRRLPSDARVSAFILYQLGDDLRFRAAVRFADAVTWFQRNHATLDQESQKLWERANVRCRLFIGAASTGLFDAELARGTN